MADELRSLLKGLQEEVLKNRTEIKSTIEASEARLLLKIENLNQRLNYLEKETTALAERIENLERCTKKNNILIFGIENNQISADYICEKLKGLLEVELSVQDLNNVYPLGRLNNIAKVEFISHFKKAEVLRNCKKLKNTGIYISQDLTLAQREENKLLREYLQKARQDPSNKSYIKGNRLYINHRSYTIEELEILDNSEEKRPNSAPQTPTRTIDLNNKEEEIINTGIDELQEISEVAGTSDRCVIPAILTLQSKLDSKNISNEKARRLRSRAQLSTLIFKK